MLLHGPTEKRDETLKAIDAYVATGGTALNDALRAVMLEGASTRMILGELALLGAWGGGSFALALRLFRWM